MNGRRLPYFLLACLGVFAAAAGCSSKDDPGDNAFSQGPNRLDQGDDDDDGDDDQPTVTSGGLPKPAPPKGSSSGGGGSSGTLGGSSGACIEIEPGAFVTDSADDGLAIYSTTIDADGHEGNLRLLFVTDEARTEDLSSTLSSNYRTCEYCTDVSIAAGQGQRDFFQQSGTLTVDSSSDIYLGRLNATLTDVKLVEVTYDDDLNTTPVPNGVCLHVASATVDVSP